MSPYSTLFRLAGIGAMAAALACAPRSQSRSVEPAAVAAPAMLSSSLTPPDFLGEREPRAQMMLLGTFHFADAGLDGYKPRFHVDIQSPERQREVEEVARLIAAYRPTKVAVEWESRHQQRVDSMYRSYAAGERELGANEVYQLGFRIARMLGHERVWLVDAPARTYFPDWTDEHYRAKSAELRPQVRQRPDWDARYTQLYQWGDSMKTVVSLREFLAFQNSAERVRQGHGHYTVGHFHLHTDGDWFGPDVETRWYNRNLRIFANLQRITESDQERILFIVGSGHLPILRFLTEASPEYEMVEPNDYLLRGRVGPAASSR
jgi:hypothetical protein